MGESEGLSLKDLTEKSVNFSTLATSNTVNEISLITKKKIHDHHAGKLSFFVETISHPEAKFYPRIHDDCNPA